MGQSLFDGNIARTDNEKNSHISYSGDGHIKCMLIPDCH